MTTRRLFRDLLGDSEEARAATGLAPALILQPFKEIEPKGKEDTHIEPIWEEGLGKTTSFTIDDVGPKLDPDPIDPEARVQWLVKSDRNPYAGLISVGRGQNNDIVLKHPGISIVHAIFYRKGDKWVIQDRRSTNGTYLNGIRLPPTQDYELSDGTELRFGLSVVVATFYEPSTFWELCAQQRAD